MELSILRRKNSSKKTVERILENLEDARLLRRTEASRVNAEILFRWGSAYPMRSLFEINTLQKIQTVDNKKLTRRLLQNSHVSIPRTYFNKDEICRSSHVHYPLIGRETYHSQGKGVIICNSIRDIVADQHSVYWSEIIDKDREFRVYVFFGKIIGMEEKIPHDRNNIIWNFSIGGATFKGIKREDYIIPVCTLAIQAATILEIDFSAIDIISKGNQDYVLELNTSPSCSGIRCKCIAKGLAWVRDEIETNHQVPQHFTLPNTIRSYRELIHPCM